MISKEMVELPKMDLWELDLFVLEVSISIDPLLAMNLSFHRL